MSLSRRTILLVVNLVVFGVAMYWLFTSSGPIRALNDLQVRWLGKYWMALSFFAVLLPAWGLLALVGKALGLEAEATQPGDDLQAAFSSDLGFPLVVLAVGCGVGGWLLSLGIGAGELRTLSVADLVAAPSLPGVMWVDLTGHFAEGGVTIQKGSQIPVLYRPFYAQPDDEGGPVPVVVAVQENELMDRIRANRDRSVTFRGVLETPIASDVAAWYDREGIPLAPRSSLLRTKRSPETDRKFGAGMIAAGLLGSGLAYWHRRRQARVDPRRLR